MDSDTSTAAAASISSPAVTEWSWLASFCTAIKSAGAFLRRDALPQEFVVPDVEPIEGGTEGLQLKPRDNSQWSLTMDEQIMAWATSRPEVNSRNQTWHKIFFSLSAYEL